MNLHVPQNWVSRTEASELMAVPEHLISMRNSRVLFGMIQDGLIGAYLLSEDHVRLTRVQCMRILGRIPRLRHLEFLPAGKSLTGKQLISMVLPKVNLCNSKVEVRDGHLIRGRLDKSVIGKSNNSLINVVARRWGNDAKLADDGLIWVAWPVNICRRCADSAVASAIVFCRQRPTRNCERLRLCVNRSNTWMQSLPACATTL